MMNTENERINNSDISKEYLKNRIIDCIETYKIQYNTDILSLSQRQFNHVLKYVSDTVIKPLRIDYRRVDILFIIADIYTDICSFFNKTTSVYSYTILINVPYTTIINNKYGSNTIRDIYIDTTNNTIIEYGLLNLYKAKNKDCNIIKVPKTIYRDLVKKIEADREAALMDKAENGSVMSLALGKIQYGWIESAKEKIQVEMMENYRLPGDLINKYSDN